MPTSGRLDRLSYAERVFFTVQLLRHCGGLRKCDLKAHLRRRYGANLSARAIERLLGYARQLLLAELDTSKAEQRAMAVAFYDSVVTGPDATMRERIKAQTRIDELLGLRFVTPVPRARDADRQGETPKPLPAMASGHGPDGT